MADLQLAAVPALPGSPTGSPFLPGRDFSEREADTIRQIVLKIAPPSEVIQVPQSIPAPQVVAAMQRLVEMIRELRSPHSGCPAEVAHVPEGIAPYVMEEIRDLMEAWESAPALNSPTGEAGNSWHRIPWQTLGLVEDLVPWILWCVARTTYETMRLVEGTSAQVYQPNSGWQQGILRLAVILHIQTPTRTYSVDLATQDQPPLCLSTDALVQLMDDGTAQPSIAVADLLQQLTSQIRSTTEAMGPLFDQLGGDWLIPHQEWQSGTLHCELGLEFVPDAVDPSTSRLITPDLVIPTTHPERLAQPASCTPLITFTDADWMQQYEGAIAHQQMVNALSLSPVPLTSPVTESQVVQEACRVLETWPPLSNSRNFPRQELGLDELALRILWCFSRSSYKVMRLLGGIPVALLQPAYAWEKGILRLMVSLRVTTPEVDWKIDLATGLPPAPYGYPLHSQGIVKFHEVGWDPSLTPVRQLQDRIWDCVQATTPEIQLLLQGTAVDLLEADHQWQAGAIQLTADFEFTPERMTWSLD